ncbi:SGNH/GDSL hydrolase family protein [Pinibacter soli]|uniref:SGNH/GDSL hydrolase family protein n=1 Tax=Pinibacter soli TaxID=3044211 RepID=A0ABT6RCP2_9BACT|nr:SGNH/GDSL hydrolase family protein [Pinibacter soli]MDI3320334.1 SGNH/GDSL hydrolase family protein [Pinibacter soli]
MHRLAVITFACISLLVCKISLAQNVKHDDSHIRYTGRIQQTDSTAVFYWTASSAKIKFKGTGISVVLKDQLGINRFTVIVDGKVQPTLNVDSTKRTYTLASGLSSGTHEVELFKQTEWAMGSTSIYGFSIDKGTTLLAAPPAKKRKIEVYGDSITCGYAVEDSTGKDRGTAPFENGYISYAAITARHFNADYVSISKSGIGILISWFPLIMPEMYDRLNPTDSNSHWNFSDYKPQVVIVNLFQNDSWLTKRPDHEQFKARFGTTAPSESQIVAAYKNFISSVRAKYPSATIVCILGNMDATGANSQWPGYVTQAVQLMNDKKVLTHFISYKKTPGHPSIREQQAAADDLIKFMEKEVKW